MHIFFSNDYSKLADQLGKRLFSYSDTPLKKRYVVVSSESVKEYLQLYFARHEKFQISAFVNFITLKEAAFLFCPKKFPSQTEIFFALLNKLNRSIQNEVLNTYLDGASKEKKILSLSYALSKFFFDFALFPKNDKAKSWQEELFYEIAKEQGWPIFSDLMKEEMLLSHSEFHLFDWDYFPKFYTLFFAKASKKNPVYYYLFSPCSTYWGDDLSDRELKNLKRKFPNTDFSLEGRNPLLSNFGMLQRKFLAFLDEHHFEEDVEYIDKGGTLLQKVQNQILHSDHLEEKEEISLDGSLRIYPVNSMMQEVEILFDEIKKLILTTHCTYQDILVLAPDIKPYIPFIRLVFGDLLEGSSAKNSYDSFLRILELSQKEGEVEEVLKILNDEAFQKNRSLSYDEVEEIKGWLKEANTRFGFSENNAHSWQNFFSRLFSSLLIEGESSLSHVDLTKVKLIDKFFRFMDSLKEDLLFFQKNISLTLFEWGEFLEKVCARYFSFENEGESLSRVFLALKKANVDKQFDFHSVLYFLQKQKQESQKFGFGSIRFASIKEGSVLSAKAICLLGMEEGTYPRYPSSFSLNPLASEFPKTQEEDRYLFLKSLLLAKDHLLIFYKAYSSEDGRTVFPSPLLQELLNYIEAKFSLDVQKITYKQTPFKPSFSEKQEKLFSLAPPIGPSLIEREVSLQDLVRLSKDPWKFHLHSMGIFLERNETHDFQNEEYLLSKLEEYYLRRSIISSNYEDEIENAEKCGRLPVSLFGEAAKLKIKEEFKDWEESLSSLGIKKEELYSLFLIPNARAQKERVCPPLKIPHDEGYSLITGEIPYLCKDGILLMEEESEEALIHYLPLLAAYLLLPSSLRPSKPKIYFAIHPSVREFHIEDPLSVLRSFLSYFEQSKKDLFPFRTELVKGFINKDPALLDKELEKMQKKSLFPNPYQEFLVKGKMLPSGKELLSTWGPLFDSYFPSRGNFS